MTIAFTGGGTGGHFYPIIAISEAIQDLVREERLVTPTLYYFGREPFDEKALFENGLTYIHIPAGKLRRYFSLKNVTDGFVTLWGTFKALLALIRIYPDVVVGKGGFDSIPTIIAARMLFIPVVIHESDAKPGRASLLAAKFAVKIAISYESAAQHFPKSVQDKIARTGIPVRKALTRTEPEGARQFLELEPNLPTVLILGGSQGAQHINEVVLTALPTLVEFCNVIHQTGRAHLAGVQAVAKVELSGNPNAKRYHAFDYLSEIALQRAAGVSRVIVSRAGSGSIAEISLWKKPAILIPIPESVSHDQRTNAYAYARTGAAAVLEEENLTPHLLSSEIKSIMTNAARAEQMAKAATGFTDPDAARIIAHEIVAIGLSHES